VTSSARRRNQEMHEFLSGTGKSSAKGRLERGGPTRGAMMEEKKVVGKNFVIYWREVENPGEAVGIKER